MLNDLNPKQVFKALTDDATCATVLHAILLTAYGEDIYTADPLELYMRLGEDFGAQLTEDNENKVNAILLAVSTDLFYDDPEGFRGICNTLMNGDPDLELLDDLTLTEILWGFYEIELNRTPSDMAPRVESMIAKAILDELDDPTETGETPYIYVNRILEEKRLQLQRQFADAGLVIPDLPPIKSPVAGVK